jgi:type II secretory pathway pseudopilin PulG
VPGFLGNIQFPITAVLAAIAALSYLISLARHRQKHFSLLDGVTVLLLMCIVTATAVPLLEAAAQGAKQSALLQNLYALRSQIEWYRAQHGGEPPVLYQGTFPQLIQATDTSGIPGPRGSKYPLGPYFPAGIPVNPITGKAVVTATEVFPPVAPSGSGGWLYHQLSGQIAVDLPEMLDR